MSINLNIHFISDNILHISFHKIENSQLIYFDIKKLKIDLSEYPY